MTPKGDGCAITPDDTTATGADVIGACANVVAAGNAETPIVMTIVSFARFIGGPTDFAKFS